MDKNREDFIKKMAINQQEIKNKEIQRSQSAVEESIQFELRQKTMLEKSGIREFFEDIIAEGSIKLLDEPVIEKTFIMDGDDNEHDPTKDIIISEYVPAMIIATDTTISLLYNYRTFQYKNVGLMIIKNDFHDEIRFTVANDVISLVSLDIESAPDNIYELMPESNYTLTPLDNNLEELIAHGFKHPLLIEGCCFTKPRVNYIYCDTLVKKSWFSRLFRK